MPKTYRDGKYYRERAEECRVIAEILSSINLRDKMLIIAADYGRMADAADKAASDAEYARELPLLR